MTQILHIDASARYQDSQSRMLSKKLTEHLIQTEPSGARRSYRDISQGLPFIDEDMIAAYYTPKDQLSEAQRAKIELSDRLVDELEQADVLVIGTPMYNFSVPAAFKAWIDLVARVGRTFRYSENGPIGLLENKRAFVVVTTGGTALGSSIDHLSNYVRHVLGFLGIEDVTVIAADELNKHLETGPDQANEQIDNRAAVAAR